MDFKEFLKTKNISDIEEVKSSNELAKLYNEFNELKGKELQKQIDGLESKEEVAKLISDSRKESTDEIAKLQKFVTEQGQKLAELEAKNNEVEKPKTFKEELYSLLKKNEENIKKLQGNRHGSVKLEMTNKVVANMALSTNVTGQIPQADRESGITRIVRRSPFILDLVNTGSISSNLWEWVEQKNPDGGAAMTAEGAAKSQADFDLVLASAKVEKVSAYIKVTTEMLDDVSLLNSEINQELGELIDLKIDDQLLNGTGVSPQVTGILPNATAFAAGSFALAVPTPNKQDVLAVAINQIRVAQFEPNYIVMHPSDVTSMRLEKATDGHYILPPFTSVDGRVVEGIPVVTNTNVTAGDFLVGDFSKSGVRFKQGLTYDMGYENDDFTKNFVTILAEARFVHRVKSNHYNAFVTGTFSTAITALTKL
jgi:HK97 family phage major capsid protein